MPQPAQKCPEPSRFNYSLIFSVSWLRRFVTPMKEKVILFVVFVIFSRSIWFCLIFISYLLRDLLFFVAFLIYVMGGPCLLCAYIKLINRKPRLMTTLFLLLTCSKFSSWLGIWSFLLIHYSLSLESINSFSVIPTVHHVSPSFIFCSDWNNPCKSFWR